MIRCTRFLVIMVLLSGCAEGQKTKPLPSAFAPPAGGDSDKAQKSLYDRLGGEKAIAKVVDDFVTNVVADPKIKEVHKKHFREGDVAGLKKKLVDKVGEATGGPQKYTGKNMKDTHRNLAISNADFDALIANLRKALDDNRAKAADRDELLKMLESMRKDVVEKAD